MVDVARELHYLRIYTIGVLRYTREHFAYMTALRVMACSKSSIGGLCQTGWTSYFNLAQRHLHIKQPVAYGVAWGDGIKNIDDMLSIVVSE